MKKFFGTDGIRGRVFEKNLTPELICILGRAAALVMSKNSENTSVFIGKDTRISGDMVESALIAGITAQGLNAVTLGVVPTPLVCAAVKNSHAVFGVVISASHNPWHDNGIKFFSSEGLKISDETESLIEKFLENPELLGSYADVPGSILTSSDLIESYVFQMKNIITHPFSGKIIADCANGAASTIAPRVFSEAGISADMIHISPDGTNINSKCGSTHLEALCNAVKQNPGTIGIAFDGDADRVLFCDENGEPVDGDQILAICANFMKENNCLPNNAVVVTVMSNYGFMKAMEELGIKAEITPVGDKYVIEQMFASGASLGGEQSGHIIFSSLNTTGDGIATAMNVLNIMATTGKPLSELKGIMKKYPQILKNIKVIDKNSWKTPAVEAKIAESEQKIKGTGRILIRPSGTEPLVRVMAEGSDYLLIQEIVDSIACEIENGGTR